MFKAKSFLQVSLQQRGAGPLDSLEMSNAFVNKKFHHNLLISSRNELKSFYKNSGYSKIFKVNTYGNVFSFFFNSVFIAPFSVLKIILVTKPTHVFFSNFHYWNIFFIVFRPIFGYKIATAAHENPFVPKEKDSSVSLKLQSIIIKKSDAILTFSNYVSKCLLPELRTSQTLLAGSLGSYFSLVNFEKIKEKDIDFIFLGRMESYKGLNIFVEALKIVEAKQQRINICVAGAGKVDLKLKDYILKTGGVFDNRWLSNELIVEYLERSKFVVLPYVQATQSGVVSAAFALSVPVVVSDVGGLSEQVTDGVTGFVFKAQDSEDLAEKLLKILYNKELQKQFSNNIKELNSTILSWDKTVEQLIKWVV